MVRMLWNATFLALFAIGARVEAQTSTSHTGARRAGIDVLHYEFRVDFPARAWPDTIRFAATTTAARGEATSLSLDLASAMQVDSAYVNGARVAFTRPVAS